MIFIFGCLILLNLIAVKVPKQLTSIEIYATSFFALSFGRTVDAFLDVKYNMYGFIIEGVNYLGVLAQFLVYPSINTLFLDLFPFHKKGKTQVLYILGWSIFSIFFEWISLQTNFFYHNTWKLWYSAFLYPILFLILISNLKLIRKISDKKNDQQILG
ncbi:CBO0543 family protein [Aquibacillus kalidii]|uniref:CBO0543 family protein n=1 Tax=Aquibacillus kalidii TaxID=2762597 RepID=UPI001647743D|nr:CBO0543 family protein [Aquibacillus kalidii]